jgi:hypothetical protein
MALRPRQVLRDALIGLFAAAILTAGVAVWQFGPSEAREIVVATLDQHHLYGPHTRFLREARRLERANPIGDAERAVRNTDFRLIGVSFCQDVPRFPGVEPALYDSYAQRFGILSMVAGDLDWPEFSRYRTALTRYAETYNQIVVQRSGR